MKLKLMPKFILSLAVLAVILTVTISLFSYYASKSYLENMYAERVLVNGNAIASMLDREDVKTILAPDGDQSEAYADMAALFDRLKADGEVTYLSLVVPDAEAVTFYIDAMVPEMGDDPADQIPYGSRILYVDAARDEADMKNYELIWERYSQDLGLDAPVITDNAYGYNYTGVAPVLDENGHAIAEIQYILDMAEVRAYLNSVLVKMLLISFAVTLLAMLCYILFVRGTVIVPVGKLAEFTQEIVGAGGITDKRAGIRTGDEIESLNDSFNYMLDALATYIDNLASVTAEKERIGAELNVATQIQADMLPCIFPAFPDRTEFDVYASMTPAKEVGGDFYDFFLIDDDHLALVMADVSGKGVPAALFMVIAKTLIKNQAQTGEYSPAKVLMQVNEQLCEGNKAELFVTVWLAILEISTGRGLAANAGHEHPALRRADGSYELVVYRHSPAVATMEGIRFREHEFELYPGDSLFVYTDGVAEATDAENQLYGTQRMLDALNGDPGAAPEKILAAVKRSVDEFVGDAPQFDDITMLCLQYAGPKQAGQERVLRVAAETEKLYEVQDFVAALLEENGCPMKTQAAIAVALEELFVNVAHYAYPDGGGWAEIRAGVADGEARITLVDGGVPFDPLQKADPDVTLAAEDRQIGGLGIYMVKKSMDGMTYERRDGQNVLTIRKKL